MAKLTPALVSVTMLLMLLGTPLVEARAQAASPAAAPAPADVQPLLANLDQVVNSTRVSLARLRIEKWRTQAEVKRRLQSDAESIERNLTHALPALVESLQAAPQSLSANFGMYRNLDALHDVLGYITQTAGAVGPEDEFSVLAQDSARLDEVRKAFAARMEQLAASSDAEIARLQGLIRKAQAATPPKRIVVDDTAPKPKPKPKATPAKAR